MTEATPIPLPLPLGDFLDGGGDPREVVGARWGSIEDDVRSLMVYGDPAYGARRAHQGRYEAQACTERRFTIPWGPGEEPDVTEDQWREMAAVWTWSADLYENPSLIARLRPFVESELVAMLDDPMLVVSEQLAGCAVQLEEIVEDAKGVVEQAAPLLKRTFGDREAVEGPQEEDAWHAKYPGERKLYDAAWQVRDLLEPLT